MNPSVAELLELVRSIPRGQVAGYGQLGRALKNPVSGLIVGRWMGLCPSDDSVPWWRVVAANGDLVIAKRHPAFAHDQAERLQAEGVELVDGLVPKTYFCEL